MDGVRSCVDIRRRVNITIRWSIAHLQGKGKQQHSILAMIRDDAHAFDEIEELSSELTSNVPQELLSSCLRTQNH